MFAWQPILTASTVIPWLLALGVLFLPLGILLLNTSNGIQEYKYDYTDCKEEQSGKRCADIINSNNYFPNPTSCECTINFNLTQTIDKEVFFYYALTNFYQNHRRYVKSRNDRQLFGYTDQDSLTSCSPFDKASVEEKKEKMLIAPCGAIANSLFNDTFKLYYQLTNVVNLLEYDIAWPTDRHYKFRNPDLDVLKNKYTKPVNWQYPLQDFRIENTNESAYENEHLIVWMRSAALPSFRKLYARVDHVDLFKHSLPKGSYKIVINYSKFVFN